MWKLQTEAGLLLYFYVGGNLYAILCKIHTADATQLSRRRCEQWTHPSAVVTQFTVSCADKWRHNDTIVEKVIKVHEYYTIQLIRMFTNVQRHVTSSYFYSVNCRIVNSVTADGCVHIAEFVGSRRELVANSYTPPTPTRRDKTISSRRRCVLGFNGMNELNEQANED